MAECTFLKEQSSKEEKEPFSISYQVLMFRDGQQCLACNYHTSNYSWATDIYSTINMK